MNLELRPTIVVDVPLAAGEVLLNPELVVIRFPHGNFVDIGALCYLKNISAKGKNRHLGRFVELRSLVDSRKQQIRKLIMLISDQLTYSSRTSVTVKNLVDAFIAFIRWADESDFNNVLESADNAKKIIIVYSHFLDDEYSKGNISLKHSTTQRGKVIRFLSEFFQEDSFKHGLVKLQSLDFIKKPQTFKIDKQAINYEIRPIKIVDLPLRVGEVLLNSEQIIIRFPSGKPVDIGALCYLKAEPIKDYKQRVTSYKECGRLVQLGSLSETRRHQVRKLIKIISDQLQYSNRNSVTVKKLVNAFIKFIRWADERDFNNVLENVDNTKQIVIFYSNFLDDEYSKGNISLRDSTTQRSIVVRFLSEFFQEDNFRHGLIKSRSLDSNKRLKPQPFKIAQKASNYKIRPIKIVDLPLGVDEVLLNPEQAIIRLPNGKSCDIGGLCYLKAEPIKDYKQGTSRYQKRGRLVQLESLSETRRYQVRKLIEHISDQLLYSGRRVETIKDFVSRFIAFMRWADEGNFHDVLDSAENAKNVVNIYAQFLKEKFLRNEISLIHAARQQTSVVNFLSEFFEEDNFSHGMFLLRVIRHTNTTTHPPSEDAQTRLLALCNALFDGITSLVIDRKSYPYKLTLPEFLQLPNNLLWLFPAESWFKRPEIALEQRKMCLGFNYLTGELNTINEIKRLRGHSLRGDEKIIVEAQSNIDAANSDFRDSQRMHVGTVALNAFVVLFLAQTGMNWAQLINLTWSHDYNIESERQLFRTIKWRAGGKECFFELPSSFMSLFKRYLQLREFLLGNQSCEWLFFKLGERGLGSPSQIKGTLHYFYKSLKKIDPDLTEIHSRQWRAAKSDWLIRNTDISTTSLVLQNTEKTVLSSYIAGSETKQWEEMSNFLNQVSDVVRDKREKTKNIILRAVGGCSSFGEPSPASKATSIASNCIEPEGCLFCDKFRIHVDEVDIRKLLSCRYCVRKTAHLVGDQEIYQKLIQPILNRIEDIITEIAKHNKDLLEKIRYEVDEEGELESYWRRKLEMFMELGVVI